MSEPDRPEDDGIVWDGESGAGTIPKANLPGGHWSVFRAPAGTRGPVGAAVFGKPVTPADLRALFDEDDEQ